MQHKTGPNGAPRGSVGTPRGMVGWGGGALAFMRAPAHFKKRRSANEPLSPRRRVVRAAAQGSRDGPSAPTLGLAGPKNNRMLRATTVAVCGAAFPEGESVCECKQAPEGAPCACCSGSLGRRCGR